MMSNKHLWLRELPLWGITASVNRRGFLTMSIARAVPGKRESDTQGLTLSGASLTVGSSLWKIIALSRQQVTHELPSGGVATS